MSPTRREFVTRAVALPIALAGLSSSRLTALAQAGLAAEQAAPDLGTVTTGRICNGSFMFGVTEGPDAGLFMEKLVVIQHADGSLSLTVTSCQDHARQRSMRLDQAHASAFFDLFRAEDGVK